MSAEPGGDTIDCDVLVAGASAGGTAAALAAAESGLTVCLTEETDWLGGQLTVQGVCTPDENRYIESLGCTRRYAAFRAAVRGYYRENYRLSEAARGQQFLNPGSCWVSGLSFEPKVGAVLLANMLAPQQAAGRLRIFFRTRVTACTMDRDRPEWIAEAAASCDDGTALRIRPRFVLDGTDCGDLLPMCGEEGPDWVIGAESCADTGEPDAPAERRADWVQPITFPFAIDWSPETAPTNLVAPPADYAELRELQRYHIKHGAITGLFAGRAPWWTYRRFLAAVNFDDPRIPADVAMINTAGNDYYGGSILGSDAGDAAQQAATLARARRAALGYLYWLQTECPREDGDGIGYPEFRLRRDVFGTEDGCALRPYIRESRRIRSMQPILEPEIVVRDFGGGVCRGDAARAAPMPIPVGIGHYALDIHPNGHGEPNHFVATRPFQIPLGSLVPRRLANLLPACKNLGTTHLTNGAYRLHPIEWNVGEAAALVAAQCLEEACMPRDLLGGGRAAGLTARLLANGVPLHWFVDVPLDHPAFEAVQTLACLGVPIGSDADLLFRPDERITAAEWAAWIAAVGIADGTTPSGFDGDRASAARTLSARLGPPDAGRQGI